MERNTLPSALPSAAGLPAPFDPADPPGLTHPTPAFGGASTSLPAKVHALLRGRYFWAVPLALLAAAAGAVVGWQMTIPTYRSEALLRVTPVYPALNLTGSADYQSGIFDLFMETQLSIMKSKAVVEPAIADLPYGLDYGSALRRLDLAHEARTELIRISVNDPDPRLAADLVRNMVRQYVKVHEARGAGERIEALEGLAERLAADAARLRGRLAGMQAPHGGDIKSELDRRLARQNQSEALLRDATIRLINAETAVERKPKDIGLLTVPAIAVLDDLMREYVRKRDELEVQISQMKREYRGADHPNLIAALTTKARLEKKIEEWAEEYRRVMASEWAPAEGKDPRPTADEIQALRRQKERVAELFRADMESALAVGLELRRAEELKAEADAAKDRLEDTRRRIAGLRMDSSLVGKLQVLSAGELPDAPSKDRRPQYAGAGAVAGAGGVIGLALLCGLLSRRLRFAAELADIPGGPDLAGVLPRLPGNPTRWKTAAPAAYGLHRLRTVLQTGPDSADRRVLAVTSPASGDGKTSLVLGLGLSFAAAGVRTLLVDLDFVNRDLSARVDRFRRRRLGELLLETNRIDAPTLDDALRQSAAAGRRLGETLAAMGRITPAELDTALARQKEAAVGLPEVLAGASVGECAADAGVANLWVLPLPPGSAGLSSSATPAMLRRVMDQAADGFDMVLIDTGPLTGSLEAMPACRAADGVLLIAGRGAGRPAVAECLTQLRRMGCTVVGSVFNRARRSELSWIRRTPMFRRRRPAGPPGPDLKPWGPLAQAVAATATPWGEVRPLRPCLPAAGA